MSSLAARLETLASGSSEVQQPLLHACGKLASRNASSTAFKCVRGVAVQQLSATRRKSPQQHGIRQAFAIETRALWFRNPHAGLVE